MHAPSRCWSYHVPDYRSPCGRQCLRPFELVLSVAGMVWGMAALTGGAEEPTSPERLPHDRPILIRTAEGTVRPARTAEEWADRRAAIRRGMEEVMGELPSREKRTPLAPRVEEEVETQKYVRRLVTYQSEPGCRTPAYLLVPNPLLGNRGGRAPAVLCLHPTHYKLGAQVVLGPAGGYDVPYAAELAERGFVTLAPHYPLMGGYEPDLARLGWASGSLKAVWDNIRGLDYLASLPFVDTARGFAVIGHSLGGHNGLYTAVFDERLSVFVSCCGFDSLIAHWLGDKLRPGRDLCQPVYMPRALAYRERPPAEFPFDEAELLAALAPRQVLVVAPLRDDNFRVETVKQVVAAARPVFELHGHGDRLRAEYPDAGHDFPAAQRERAYRLIETVLRPAP